MQAATVAPLITSRALPVIIGGFKGKPPPRKRPLTTACHRNTLANAMSVWALLLLGMAEAAGCPSCRPACEPVRLPLCRHMPYNMTRMPNVLQHSTQENAILASEQFEVLVQTRCSDLLPFFLCTMYAPICTLDFGVEAIPPCRSVCERARDGCEPLLNRFNVSWPEVLRCDQLPEYEKSVCVTPEAIVTDAGKFPKAGSDHNQLIHRRPADHCNCKNRIRLKRRAYLKNNYDYVIIANVTSSEVIGDLTLTKAHVLEVLKHRRVPIKACSEVLLWTNSTCICPSNLRDHSYVFLGWEDPSTNRLLFNNGSIASRWNRSRLTRLKKWESKLVHIQKKKLRRRLSQSFQKQQKQRMNYIRTISRVPSRRSKGRRQF